MKLQLSKLILSSSTSFTVMKGIPFSTNFGVPWLPSVTLTQMSFRSLYSGFMIIFLQHCFYFLQFSRDLFLQSRQILDQDFRLFVLEGLVLDLLVSGNRKTVIVLLYRTERH